MAPSKKSRKRKAWTKLEVGLTEPEDESSANHYDEDSAKKVAPPDRDLEANPGEEVAMFYGLEVLDGSAYQLEKRDGITHLKVIGEEGQEGGEQDAELEQPKAKKRKKKKKTSKETNEEKSQPVTDSSEVLPQNASASTQADIEDKPQDSIKSKKNNKKKKKKKKGKDKGKETSECHGKAIEEEEEETPQETTQKQEDVENIQTQWCIATGGTMLHPKLCQALQDQDFWSPTPVQAAALPAAILGRRNIVGAAPTGSGKTLAFLLPICQHLLEMEDTDNRPLQALILTPTRELALQVQAEGHKLLAHARGNKMIGSIVGGLAHAKQVRVLDKDRPPILVGTVGRLWELLSSRNHPHLNNLSQLHFLVIDEADRMVQQGGFPQLRQILDVVQKANPMDDSDDEEEQGFEDDEDDPDRMLGLPGIRGESRVQMLSDDILRQIEAQRNETAGITQEIGDEQFMQPDEDTDEDEDEEVSLPMTPPVLRQTFVYSATLTLPASASFQKTKKNIDGVEGAIAEILEKSRAKGKTKIIDLSHAGKSTVSNNIKDPQQTQKEKKGSRFKLPPGLTLQEIKCTQLHKDSHLYAYLMTTAPNGPCLVFCNSIAGVKRVGATLQALKVQVRMLHANLQQRARLNVVEFLRKAKGRVVVVATDVAARGLDIPSVAAVVHYDAARNVDTFVHRSGRTARGMGASAVGFSVSLVSSNEDKMHNGLVRKLGLNFEKVFMDGRLMNGAQERVNLASKVVAAEGVQSKSQRNNAWFKDKADEMGLELDDNMLDGGLEDGDQRDQSRLREAKKAKIRLHNLLREPLQTQRYGKFLSTNSAHLLGGRGVVR